MRPVLILLLLQLVPSLARAKTPSAATDRSTLEEARLHFSNGTRFYQQRRNSEALAEFQAGYQLSKRAGFLLNIAQCYRALNDLDKARENYQAYLAADPNSPHADQARTLIKEIDDELDALSQAELGEGRRAYDARRYADAIAHFHKGNAIKVRPEFLFGIAESYRKSDDCTHAVDAYREFLKTEPAEPQAGSARRELGGCENILAAQQAQAKLAEVPKPKSLGPRVYVPWYKDVVGDTLAGIGIGFLAVGAGTFGAGYADVRDQSTTHNYARFDQLAASSGTSYTLEVVGAVGLAVGGVALVSGVARWIYVARHGPPRERLSLEANAK